MSNNHFSRKERQLKNHILKLNEILKRNKGFISNEIQNLIFKIKELVNILKNIISLRKLRYILGSFAFLFGINSNEVNAQSFVSPVINPFGLTLNSNISGYNYYTGKAQFVDLDNDGDLDLLYETLDIDTSYYSYYSNNIFVYHENIGTSTNPQFSIGVKNPFNLTSPQNFSLYGSLLSHNLIDLDNDGDYDLLATYSGFYQNYSYGTYSYDQSAHTVFKYYENIGNPTIPLFAAQQTNPFGLELDSVIGISDVVDIDGDGDYDVISSIAVFGNQGYIQNQDMGFIENIGTSNNPQFTSPQVNLIGITFPSSYYPVMPSFGDIDNDGDYDLITTPYEDNGSTQYKFLYQQNKGSATNAIMSLQAQNPFGLSPDTSYAGIIIHSELADLDGDGDMDIVTSGFYGNNFLFFENNNSSTNIGNLTKDNINIYPNPASEIINIESEYQISYIEIVDYLGKIIIKTDNYKTLNINELNNGMYSINIYTENKKITKKFTKI
ncbi:MAG: T9SS type A sorting domain-containing protein [Flavobacteriales bacterium]